MRTSFYLPERILTAVAYVKRAEPRLPASLAARIGVEGQPEARLSVRNFSRSGISGRVAGRIQPGTGVTLKLPFAGTIGAQVRWCLNGNLGCSLIGRLSRRQMAILMLLSVRNVLFSREGFHVIVAVAACALMVVLG